MDNKNYEYEEKIDKQLMQKSQIDSADDKNDSIEYKLNLSKLRSSSWFDSSVVYLRYVSFFVALGVLIPFTIHFFNLSDQFKDISEIYKEAKSADILWLYGFSLFSTVLVITSIVLGLINIYSSNKSKRNLETAQTAYLKEVNKLLNMVSDK